MSDIPAALPAGVTAYSRTPDFTPQNIPDKIRAAHATKAGTWGLLHVLEGRLLYRLEAPRHGERRLAAGETVVIEPTIRHHVAFLEPGRFFVEFYR
jgi:hemoglobin